MRIKKKRGKIIFSFMKEFDPHFIFISYTFLINIPFINQLF